MLYICISVLSINDTFVIIKIYYIIMVENTSFEKKN